jgi:hypothetical protein
LKSTFALNYIGSLGCHKADSENQVYNFQPCCPRPLKGRGFWMGTKVNHL